MYVLKIINGGITQYWCYTMIVWLSNYWFIPWEDHLKPTDNYRPIIFYILFLKETTIQSFFYFQNNCFQVLYSSSFYLLIATYFHRSYKLYNYIVCSLRQSLFTVYYDNNRRRKRLSPDTATTPCRPVASHPWDLDRWTVTLSDGYKWPTPFLAARRAARSTSAAVRLNTLSQPNPCKCCATHDGERALLSLLSLHLSRRCE